MTIDRRAFEAIESRAAELRVTLTHELAVQLACYWNLLAKWDRRSNLTGLSMDGFPPVALDRLLMEPVVAAQSLRTIPADTWFDFGSGGGSPAIPIKMAFPQPSLTLVESRGRKGAFLREAIEALSLTGTSVFPGRIEMLPEACNGSADLVTVRGLRLSRKITDRAHSILKVGARLALFGTDVVPGVDPLKFQLAFTTDLPSTMSTLRVFERV